MTRSEFEKIKADYDRETEWWSKLVVGQHVYVSDPYLDWFDHEIIAIDVDNRQLVCLDHSLNKKQVTIGGGFQTAEELRARGCALRDCMGLP